ncbi:hypothetical protein GGR26_000370 [Lewinella marina]|uniref:DUF2892 domain-containing protein n=1 Tax=Neolewinella marina TaxID=438751 RepID=UPI00117AF0F7|nr:DUF2892 domain-containing protein [Neolewinella marina]NJB84625.1 hypothetical protein [Neolewinella marina]
MQATYQPLEHSPTGRVSEQTADSVNREIGQDIIDRVEQLAKNPSAIPGRLEELSKEWDVERMLETNASTLTLVGLALGLTVDRRWLILSGTVAAFLLQHGIQGYCPPLVVLRKLGFRTREEIDWERIALKAVRGDFAALNDIHDPRERARAALTFAGE